MSIRAEISDLVRAALGAAHESGTLPQVDVDDMAIERPQKPENGDYSCSMAMKLARAMRMNPRAIGEAIVEALPPSEMVGRVWVAGPGFVNFSLDDGWLSSRVDTVIEAGDDYGNSNVGEGDRIQIEFVSVNPTGPVHVGHARGAVLGSALANVLDAAGYDVQREYYVNDAGNQMELFYQSVHARYLQAWDRPAEVPADGYMGDYLVDTARAIKEEHGDRFLHMASEAAVSEIGAVGLDMMVGSIEASLARLRVEYDRWFKEKSLYDDGEYDRVMRLLDEQRISDAARRRRLVRGHGAR